MEIEEAQKRYGDAIAQIMNKYAAVIESPRKMTVEDGINILLKNADLDPRVEPVMEHIIEGIQKQAKKEPKTIKVGR